MFFAVSFGVALLAVSAQAGVLYSGATAASFAPVAPVGTGYNYPQQYKFLSGPSPAGNVPAAPSRAYSFNYDIAAPDGVQSRQEASNASGNVNGLYAFSLNDGRRRNVRYTAGPNGFKAAIDSNEQGVDTKSAPADVTYSPQAPVNFPTAVPAPARVVSGARGFTFLAIPTIAIPHDKAYPWP